MLRKGSMVCGANVTTTNLCFTTCPKNGANFTRGNLSNRALTGCSVNYCFGLGGNFRESQKGESYVITDRGPYLLCSIEVFWRHMLGFAAFFQDLVAQFSFPNPRGGSA